MTNFFFPGNKCGIDNKVEKPVFKFVADCDIEPTPKPIFDCTLPIVPREPDFPCPEFSTKATLKTGFSGGGNGNENCDVQNKIRFDIVRKVSDECPAKEACEFEAEIDVEIKYPPIPCPGINVTTFKVKSGFADQPCVEDESRFKITQRKIIGKDCEDPGSCEFDIDLEILVPIPRIPCPDINVTTFSVTSDYATNCSRGRNRFEIKPRHRPPTGCDDPGDCKFDVELEIHVLLPEPPCPDIKVNDFRVTSGFDVEGCSRPENKFEIRRNYRPAPCGDPNDNGDCDFEVDLSIHIPIPPPPCPDINITKFVVKSGYKNTECSEGTNRFVISKRSIPGSCDVPEKCEFDIELEILIPIPQIPCPKINVKIFKVTSNWETCKDKIPDEERGRNRFVITTNHRPPENCSDDGGECDFNIELEIDVPIPVPPCPKINVNIFKVICGYPIRVCDTSPDQDQCSGENKFTITKKIVEEECKDENGNLKPPTCEFDVELQIFIPPPLIPCPDINVKEFKVNVGFKDTECVAGENKFIITRRVTPCTCDEPEKCEFDFELEINVPIPRPVCPEICINTFSVKTKYEGSNCYATTSGQGGEGESKFEIKIVEKPVTELGCDESSPPCQFQFSLDIVVPLPAPPCPEINIKVFEVTSGYEPCTTGKNKFTVTKREEEPACDGQSPGVSCAFDFELSIYVPIPVPPCPNIATNLLVNYIPYNGLGGIPNVNECNFFTATKRRDNNCASGEETSCTFDLDLQICVPIPVFPVPCPKINIKVFKVESQFDDCKFPNQSKFVVNQRNQPQVVNGVIVWPQFCEFDFELELYIPIPKMKCPEIQTNLALKTYISGCRPNASFFKIEKNHVAGNCNKAEECAFLLDLSLDIPIPRFVQTVGITVKNPTVKVNWCTEAGYNGLGGASTAKILFNRTINNAAACDRGTDYLFEMQFDLSIVLPAPPCSLLKLTSKREKIPVTRLETTEEYAKLSITPKQASGAGNCLPCEWEFDIDLTLQCPPCPEFYTEGNVKINQELTPEEEPYGTLKFQPRARYACATEPCVFDVFLELYLRKPCIPQFSWDSGGSQVNPCYYSDRQTQITSCPGDHPVEVWIERDGDEYDCKYKVRTYSKPAVYRPPEKKCDEFNITEAKVFYLPSPTAEPYVEFDIKPRSLDPLLDTHCTYDVTLKIHVAKPCEPEFTWNSGRSDTNECRYSTRSEYLTCGADPGKIEVHIEKQDDCKYEVYTYWKPPIYEPSVSCDVFNGDVDVNLISIDADPYGTITFKPQPLTDSSDSCTYDVDLKLWLPKPCKPKFHSGYQNVSISLGSPYSAPTGTIDVSIQESGDCNYTVNATVNLSIPSNRPICNGNVYVNGGTLGSGTLSCSGDDLYIIDINLNTTSCPTSGGSTSYLKMPPELSGMQTADFPVMESTLPLQIKTVSEFTPDVIMDLWENPIFIDGFIAALGTNKPLKDAIKKVLAE